MGYTIPRSLDVGDDMTVPIWHTDVRDNIIALRAGEIAVPGAAAGDDVYMSAAAQLAAGSRQLRQTFRGLVSRTHPDSDKAAYQCLASCAAAVMSDGAQIENWSNILFDITASGAGGLDTGTEQPSTWYQKYLIRKSSDGTKAGLLHRAKNYRKDASYEPGSSDSGVSFGNTTNTRGAHSFPAATSGPLVMADAMIGHVTGAPAGVVYATLEADSGGSPSGTPLATSRKIDASALAVYTASQWVRFIFDAPYSVTASTTYWLVLRTTVNSATNYVNWRANSAAGHAGTTKYYNGSSWASYSSDSIFRVFVTENDTAITLPSGYDQYCLIGWVYNDSGSNFVAMSAKDRVVNQYGVAVSAGTATIATLVDTSGRMHPPTPVFMTVASMRGSSAASRIKFGPDVAISFDLGVYWDIPVADIFGPVAANVLVEFQSFYYTVAAGNAFIYPLVYQW